jgi:hypothetical protein
MSFSESIVGYLDVRNAILRVGKMHVDSVVGGVDSSTNIFTRNSVLLWDRQEDVENPPFTTLTDATRSTSPPEITLTAGSGSASAGLKLPNSWICAFDLYGSDSLKMHMYTTSETTNVVGYELVFNNGSGVTLNYDGVGQVATASHTWTAAEWNRVVVGFERGAWTVSINGTPVLVFDDVERSAIYDDVGQFFRLDASGASSTTKIRYVKILTDGKWLQSNVGTLSYAQGNVVIGGDATEFKLDVRGTANVGTLTATSISMDEATHAVNTSTGAIVITQGGLGVASNVHGDNVFAASHLAVGTTATSYNFEVSGTSNMDSLTAERVDVTEATHSTSKDTGALIVTQGGLGVESNIHGTNVFAASHLGVGTTATSHALDINGTANFQSNVYAPNLQVAPTAANLVTWNSSTGDFMDSGGLISNKLAIVSEQPPAALTAATTTVDGHGKYTVYASNVATNSNAWNAFDQSGSVWWESTEVYSGGAGGEYLKITFPYKTTLRHFVYTGKSGAYTSWAKAANIAGSNDDSTWTTLASFSGFGPTSDDPKTVVVNASAPYKHYKFTITENSGSVDYATVAQLKLFTESFSVDAGVVSTTAASGLDVGYTEHPVEPMTDYHTHVEGHGTYEASASGTYYNGISYRFPWKAFDYGAAQNGKGHFMCFQSTYSGSSPYNYIGSTTLVDVGGTRYNGEYLTLKLPYGIILSHCTLTSLTNYAPVDGFIFGSSNGTDWYKLTSFTGRGVNDNVTVNSTTPYTHYRLLVTKLNGGEGQFLVEEWRLFAEKPVTRMENVHISGDLSSETLQTGYIKWPKVPLKAAESEGYVASASSQLNTGDYASWHAFEDKGEYKNNISFPCWLSTNSPATFGTGGVAQISRTTGDDTFAHEWLQIQLPTSITLSYFVITESRYQTETPKSGRMYGSNDGIAFTKLATFSDKSGLIGRIDVNASSKYKYFRLAVTETQGSPNYVAINELQLFEAATGVGAAPTSAKLQVAGSLGMAKGSEFFAGDDVVMELPKHDRPLVKYPEVVMTTSQDVTTLTYEGYTVSASNDRGSTYRPWKAFDGLRVNAGGWATGDYYDSSTGAAKNTSTQFEGNYGEYLELQLPVMIKLEKVVIKPRDVNDAKVPEDAPGSGYIYASNDGSDWTLLHSFSGLSYGGASSNGDATNETLQVNASHAYKYYRLQATSRSGQNLTDEYVNIAELEYWGYEEGDTSVDVIHRSIPNKPSPQHLEVYWDANDSNSYSFADSSNVYDLSGNGRMGTLTNGVGFDTEYNAFTFDGVNDIITVSNAGNGTGQWIHSSSVWFKRSSDTSQYAEAIWHLGTKNYGQASSLITIGDELALDIWSTRVRVVDFVKNDQWYHVCGVYRGGSWNSTNVDLYVNGVKIKTTVVDADTVNLQGTTLSIGGRDATTDLWHGSIANFRLFSKALNADQVRELYEFDAPRFGHRQNLVALHKGNLGVGVSHPTSRFEVAGTETLQEYPPRGMTGYETYMEGHGVFRASASSVLTSYFAWYAFTNISFTEYISSSVDHYTKTGGIYQGTNGTAGYAGEWLSIELPYAIKLSSYCLMPQTSGGSSLYNRRMPITGVILGSNDCMNWDVIHLHSLSLSDYVYNSYTHVKVSETDKSYTHIRLVVTSISPNDTVDGVNYAGHLSIGQWLLFGTPAPSGLEDGHLTLGKALTLPRVSGHPAGAETPRAESLVVHYDTTVDSVVSGTTVVDISGEGNNGTLNGATYDSTARCLHGDGPTAGDYTATPITLTGGAMSLSIGMWFRANTLASSSSDYRILSLVGTKASGQAFIVSYSSTHLVQDWYSKDYRSSFTLQANTWYHTVTTYNGGNIQSGSSKIYLNGVELSGSTAYTGTLNLPTAQTSLELFDYVNGSNDRHDGDISNFKLWSGVALTAEEVAMEYALGRTGKSLNLTDTALCLGGTVPRAQLDVRGGAVVDGFVGIDGDVGIGTNDPDSRLVVQVGGTNNTVRTGLILRTPDSDIGTGYNIDFHQSTTLVGRITSLTEGGGAIGMAFSTYNGSTTERMRIDSSGNVGIGQTNPAARLSIKQRDYAWDGGIDIEDADTSNVWHILVSTGENLYFAYNDSLRGYLDNTVSVGQIDFTGQHRNFIDGVPYTEYDNLEGLVVSANKNKYYDINEAITTGANAIQISQSLPLVSLSTKEKDKACFGVISGSEDPEKREYSQGSFVSVAQKQKGDRRAFINSVGEGAMWVVNTAGALESGDYITTSNVAGYGQGQDDDILHNYTVAKITMDCDFNPPDIPVQRILKELSNITYWFQLEDATSNAYDRTEEETYYTKDRRVEVYGAVDEQSNVFVPPDHDLELYSKTQVNTVSKEVYDALPVDEQALYDSNTFTYTQIIEVSPEVWEDLEPEEQNTYVHRYYKIYVDEVPMETSDAVERTRTVYKKVVNDTKVEPERPEDYLSEVRQEWVNVLDEHGQLQWEDVPWGETEPAYKIRYLDASGNLTTRHNAVHLAAFVGVTYHCG